MSCIGFAQFSGFFLLRGSGRWHFSKLHLFGAQGLAAAGLALLFAATGPWVFASAFLMLGLCASLTYYSSLYYAVRLLKRKGKGAGLHESILGGGVVLGPLLGGIAAHAAGLRAPYLLCLTLLAVVAAAEWFILRTESKR
jgi:MFS family permease